ncbi:MAG: hypothetical protein JO328_16540 [Hyphomicrobiales bacterium]|nr:hypothetical protein [Hyphomicrobiales bacterium]MBV8824341.1 hypothetical protein [Hyphomicrobiales bacterium]
MTDVTGMLQGYHVRSSAPVPTQWLVEIDLDKETYKGVTDSTICFAVLQSAILTARKWKVTLVVDDKVDKIERIRIEDDRADICTGAGPPPQGPIQSYLPLTPTFFGDDKPDPKWGFFFAVEDKCTEYKGLKLDVYAIIESAWRAKKNVMLELDKDLIVGAKISNP